MRWKARILGILFWSIISAAFIGPGTVTTAAGAGALFGLDLLWALVFSTFTCLLLQEAAARITIITGRNLGEAIALKMKGRSGHIPVLLLVVGAIIVGSAAYETGNLLGAASGIALIWDLPVAYTVVFLGVLAAIALYFPATRVLARAMGIIVVVMGICFLVTAIAILPSFKEILYGSVVPRVPEGSGLLVLGLIGTTVVPYNLFLGSGMAEKGKSMVDMRIGLSTAIILGGIISMSVVITGTAVGETFSFRSLADALSNRLGEWAIWMFGIGLLAAGFSSAVTAPLASAITAESLFRKDTSDWSATSLKYKLTWGLVLVTGLAFGMAGFRPIPAIIVAQAMNGLILPFVAVFLMVVINDPGFMGKENVNSTAGNLMMILVTWVSMILGAYNVIRAAGNLFTINEQLRQWLVIIAAILAMGLAVALYLSIMQARKRSYD